MSEEGHAERGAEDDGESPAEAPEDADSTPPDRETEPETLADAADSTDPAEDGPTAEAE